MAGNEVASSMRTYQTEDAREGRAAFLAKRPAVFRGA
jgi:1,4-dihydroxy-2-naphthoyl-CoA synthase